VPGRPGREDLAAETDRRRASLTATVEAARCRGLRRPSTGTARWAPPLAGKVRTAERFCVGSTKT